MKKSLILVVIALFLITPLFADGGGPVRPISEAEKSYSLKMSQALGKLFPKTPEGWNDGGPVDTQRVEDTVSVGSEKQVFTLSLSQDYAREVDPAVEEAQYKATAQLMASDPSALKAKEIMKKFEELSKEVGKAIEKQDAIAMERLNTEMESLRKESDAAQKTQNALMNANLASISNNRTARVRFEVNSLQQSLYNAEPFPGLPKEVIALWVPSSSDSSLDKTQGDLTLGFGAYQTKKEESSTYLELTGNDEASHLKTRGIIVRVTGARNTVEKLLTAIDIKAIQALID